MTRTDTASPGPAPPPAGIDLSSHAFFLDFDGTLVPIAQRPQDVRLATQTRALLERLTRATGGAVAIVSGRALGDLRGHLGGLDLALSGSHGHELHLPGAPETAAPETAAPAPPPALESVFRALSPLAQAESLLIERKAGAVALHYRNRPDLADDCRAALETAAIGAGLRALHGNMVSEALMPGGDKGIALARLLGLPPFRGRVPVMIGDDTTDEDGFRAAQARGGFGLRIGGTVTAARHHVPTMDEALDWLSAQIPAARV